jgi:hypothetical protein
MLDLHYPEVNMRTGHLLSAVLLVMAGTVPAQVHQTPHDDRSPPGGQAYQMRSEPVAGMPATVAALHPEGGLPSPDLLAALSAWLSTQLNLPALGELPSVRLASPAVLSAIRCSAAYPDTTRAGEPTCDGVVSSQLEHDTMALYEDATRTIHLRTGWTGATPAELSVLVHEMVHHLQNLGGLVYECPDARERPAFIAQARWLELFGRTLESEFSMDPMTLLFRTTCPR